MVEKSVGIGLILFGILEWVERAGFFEPLALSTQSIAQGTEHRAHCAFELRNVPIGSAVCFATDRPLDLL